MAFPHREGLNFYELQINLATTEVTIPFPKNFGFDFAQIIQTIKQVLVMFFKIRTVSVQYVTAVIWKMHQTLVIVEFQPQGAVPCSGNHSSQVLFMIVITEMVVGVFVE